MQAGLIEKTRFVSSKIGERDVDKIETGLAGIEGIRSVEVTPEEHAVVITYDPTILDSNRLRAEFEDLGYSLDS
jgi:copper chaperone CopZ